MPKKLSIEKAEPKPDQAVVEVAKLITEKFVPQSLDQLHEYLKLLGIVVGQFTLLEMATSSTDAKARVAAARALLSNKERPEDVAERLRRSPFAHLSAEQLHAIIKEAKVSGADAVHSLIEGASHGNPPSE